VEEIPVKSQMVLLTAPWVTGFLLVTPTTRALRVFAKSSDYQMKHEKNGRAVSDEPIA